MDSITLVVGGGGRLGLGLGKIRTTIQLGKIRTTIQLGKIRTAIQLGKIRITIPGRVQMLDKTGVQILDTFWGPTHTKQKWSEGGYHSKNPKHCWKDHFIHLLELIIGRELKHTKFIVL